MKRLISLVLAAWLLVGTGLGQTPAFVSDSLDRYIQRGMAAWEIPGLAIAVVKDGKVVLSKGYGVREMGKTEPVDENTLFLIASNTKLFTGTALAKLAEEKKLSLNDKVTKHLPDYALYDPNATRLVTIRDLLCHRLGTKTFQGDFTFWNTNLSRSEVIRRMRLLKPPGEFRQDYGYCNSAFVTAGEIIPKVTGQSWEQYVETNLVKPLGMTNTYMLTAGVGDRPNVARPHTSSFGSLTRIPYDNIDNLAPAGSMVSCVKDLSNWLLMQLDSGRFNGKTVLPWSVVQRTRDANIILNSRAPRQAPSHFTAYGLGVLTTDYYGKQVYWHTGGAFGFVTNTCFVPEANLGITILTNNDNQPFFEILRHQILTAYLGNPAPNAPATDRNQTALAFARKARQQETQTLTALEERVAKKNKPALPLSAYVGTYQNSLYGTIRIAADGPALKMSFEHHPSLTARLDYMDGQEFRLTYSHRAFGIFPAKFTVDGSTIQSLEVKASDFVEYDPYQFTKVPVR